jgi:fumarate reductase flavoprotein subunit
MPKENTVQHYRAGVYQAETQGRRGKVTVQTVLSENRIVSVSVTSHQETPGIFDTVIARVPKQIIDEQTLAVDAVTGATVTKNAIIFGVQACIEQAGGNVQELFRKQNKAVSVPAKQSLSTDIVVVGGGIAGVSAAIAAAQNGAKVILVERQAFLGGSSGLASGVFDLGGTDLQKAKGIEDTPDAFNQYLLDAARGQGGERDPRQTFMVATHGNELISWLTSHGVVFENSVSAGMGSPTPRSHRVIPNAATMMVSLYQAAQKAGVSIMLETTVTKINKNNIGGAIGVEAESVRGEQYTINSTYTVLATGGYRASKEMTRRFLGPLFENVVYTGSIGNQGEMLAYTIDNFNADTVDLDKPFLSPTATKEGIDIASSVLSKGGILVTYEAQRYCDETVSYLEAATNTLNLHAPDDIVFEIFDHHTREVERDIEEYVPLGILVIDDTIEGLAKKLELDPAALRATVDKYNEIVNGKPDPFGRKIFAEPMNHPPYYGIKVTPSGTLSGGGLMVDETCQVIKTDGSLVPNLYAVGEITGGFRAFGYAAGDSLSHSAISGKITGETLAKKL